MGFRKNRESSLPPAPVFESPVVVPLADMLEKVKVDDASVNLLPLVADEVEVSVADLGVSAEDIEVDEPGPSIPPAAPSAKPTKKVKNALKESVE